MIQEFSSKVDTWLLLVLVLTIVISAVGGLSLMRWRGGLTGYGSGILLISICTVLPIWLLLDTNYTVSSESLVIKSGPRVWLIPVSSISSVEETRESWSSPALSLDRLKVHYGNSRTIMVSPEDKRGFLQALGHLKQ